MRLVTGARNMTPGTVGPRHSTLTLRIVVNNMITSMSGTLHVTADIADQKRSIVRSSAVCFDSSNHRHHAGPHSEVSCDQMRAFGVLWRAIRPKILCLQGLGSVYQPK